MAGAVARAAEENLGTIQRQAGGEDVVRETESVFASLGVPIAGGLLGWYTSYVIGQKLEGRELVRRDMAGSVLPQAEIAGWGLSALAAGSIFASGALRLLGRRADAQFVGEWAPTFTGLAVLARVFGHRSLVTGGPIEPVSWALVGAGLASMLSAIAMHVRGERTDGVFVGQWAPTLVSAGVLTRLFGELREKK